MSLSLGMDTGGTCTDAVLIDDAGRIVASAKALTTHGRLIEGLSAAASAVLAGQDVTRITLVSLSTTLATNALVEDQGRPVGLILIGHSPERLKRARLGEALRGDPVLFIDGGHAADGSEAAALDRQALRAGAAAMAPRIDAWAVSSMFSVRNPAHELAAAQLLRQVADLPVSPGHVLSSALDAPRRALTALLNARLVPPIVELMDAAQRMLGEAGVRAPLMVVKGDGTLIDAGLARERPIETILSGPAASVVGARHLCGAMNDAIVVDIGGTTTDVARIVAGRPRLSADGARVAGWPTRVAAIEVSSIGLGGDSAVTLHGPRQIGLGPGRIVPLALSAQHAPGILDDLRRQLERGYPVSHDASFVQVRPAGKRQPGSAAQRELLERIRPGTQALTTLFAGGTSALALERLERQGFAQRIGFTPTDACHVLGTQKQWCSEAAWSGARLCLRQVSADASRDDAAVQAFCRRVLDELVRLSAVAIARSALDLDDAAVPDRDARARWLDEMLLPAGVSADAAVSLLPRVRVPVIGLGASAGQVHPQAAQRLGTRAELPEHGDVANAIGAVVGVVRQESTLLILPIDRERVRLMLADGPVVHEHYRDALAAAEPVVRQAALDAALAAGASDVSVQVERDEKRIAADGASVLLECTLRAVAVGRPRPG